METIGWLGTALIVLSRIGLIQGNMWIGFSLAAAGSFCWIVYAMSNRIWSLVVVDTVMLVMDVYGAVKWI